MKVSEPIATYNTSYLQGLKNRLIASISVSKDEKALEGCLELLKAHDMPCVFSDEEFARWLADMRNHDRKLQVEVKYIYIRDL